MRNGWGIGAMCVLAVCGCADEQQLELGATTAAVELGANDFRISNTGPDGDIARDALNPAVTYNATDDEYFVVWYSDAVLDGEGEIFGQRLAADGSELGGDIRISTCGVDGDVTFDAQDASIAWNSDDDEYFVVWVCDQVASAEEVYGQRISNSGALIGGAIRLSQMGPEDVAGYAAYEPGVVYVASTGEYIVVWSGDDAINGKQELWGQRVSAAGVEVGANDFLIATSGPASDVAYDAVDPHLVLNPSAGEVLVVYTADTSVSGEDEIFAQRVAVDGTVIGSPVRVSNMAADGNAAYDAELARVAYAATANEYLVVWDADDDSGALLDNKLEVYAQRLDATAAPVGGRIRVSFTATDADASRDGLFPDVAWDSADNEYFVVWYADQVNPNENEIHGRRLSATGALLDVEYRLSDMGPEGDTTYRAMASKVAYNATRDQLLVVWNGDDDIAPLVEGADEVFGQLWGDVVPTDPDAGVPDATPPPDASPPDATIIPDAMVVPDAAPPDATVVPDAALPDATVVPDAAPLDAMVVPDAAPPDATVVADAMVVPDAAAPSADAAAPAADAGEPDASGTGEEMNPPDASTSSGNDDDKGGGCDCRTASGGGAGNAWLLALALCFAIRRRRR